MSLKLQIVKTCLIVLITVFPLVISAQKMPKWNLYQFSEKPSLRSSAIKDNIIWVAGTQGKVYKSLDKGKNWIDVSLKEKGKVDIRDIQVFGKNTAILMSVGSGENSRLYKTINGGINWQVLYQNTDETGFFDSIAFWDNKNGLLLGDPVDGYYVIKKTKDGGKTWHRIASENLPNILNKEAAFAASGNTLIVDKRVKAWFTTGGNSASIMSSTDMGETWDRHSLPLYNKTETAGGYGIATNSLDEIFVVGGDYLQRDGDYTNLVSHDNIGNWLAMPSGNRGLRTAIICEKSTCIITGKLSSDISFDKGHTWTPFHTQGFYTLASEGKTVIAAGADGKVSVITLD